MTEKELIDTINTHLGTRVQNGELKNESVVSIIETLGRFLNAETISDYAKREKISYNGTLQRIGIGKLKTFTLFNTKFVIDND
jgi:hypothetical protein